jgi:lactate dehydrogenase-like 2-hydroxyacid dehydrogenase
MQPWACDPFVSDEQFAQEGVRRADLAALMGLADIVSLHAPLSPETRGMISADLLLLMKEHSLLINTAAVELVDLAGLRMALERGRPAAAAFDEDLTDSLTGPDHRRPVRLKHGPRQAGRSLEITTACRREAGRLLLSVLQGNRPGHLLIDPPCPRHILLLANQHWN